MTSLKKGCKQLLSRIDTELAEIQFTKDNLDEYVEIDVDYFKEICDPLDDFEVKAVTTYLRTEKLKTLDQAKDRFESLRDVITDALAED
jgi:tRNA A37 threonylcarbamoyladenosine dehydratase